MEMLIIERERFFTFHVSPENYQKIFRYVISLYEKDADKELLDELVFRSSSHEKDDD